MERTHPDPVGNYEPYTVGNQMVFVSGISSARDGELITGKVGTDIDIDRAKEAARRAAENLVSLLIDAAMNTRSTIAKIVLVRGYVNAAEDFPLVHEVIDAASEVIIEHFGHAGRHARTSLGCATLPNLNAVTLEATALLSDL